MRIGLFTNNYRPLINGLATSVESFSGAFRRAGHQVTVVAPRYPGAYTPEADILRVPGLRAPTHHAYVLPMAWWPGVGRAVNALRLDIFHAQHPLLLGAAAARWARRAGRPVVFTYHTHYDRYAHYIPGPSGVVARLAVRQAVAFANRADLVVAPGSGVARVLRDRGVRTPIAIVPTGVERSPGTTGDHGPGHRELLGLGGALPVFLSVGRLAREKNHAFLLSAFARILRELPAARLVLVGDGDDRPRLERLSGALGVEQAVRFVGAVPHQAVGKYYLAADLLLCSSTSETQGIVVLEAMVAGLPVVAVTSDAATDLLADGQGGILAPEDTEGFARAALDLWRQPERRRLMGAAGRRAAAGFTPDACAGRMLTLYAEILQAFRSRACNARAVRPTMAGT